MFRVFGLRGMLQSQRKPCDVVFGYIHFGTAAVEQFVVADPGLACSAARSQALATAKLRAAEHSVAMAFQQHAAGAHACLLALHSSEWEGSVGCPGANPAALQFGRVADRAWQLEDWQPHGAMVGTLQLRWSDGSQSRLDLELLP